MKRDFLNDISRLSAIAAVAFVLLGTAFAASPLRAEALTQKEVKRVISAALAGAETDAILPEDKAKAAEETPKKETAAEGASDTASEMIIIEDNGEPHFPGDKPELEIAAGYDEAEHGRFSQDFWTDGEKPVTHIEALGLALEAMGWGFAITAVDQVGLLPNWPHINGVPYIASTMTPRPPFVMLWSLDAPLLKEELEGFMEWLRSCRASVSWQGNFRWGDMELLMIKRGVGNPRGSANGDIINGVNEPLFVAALYVDMKYVPCQIASAELIGSKRAALATIASENFGVIGGINGGYFSDASPIGVLRRQGYTANARFWPNRSAFGWNSEGEFIFIDGKTVNNIGSARQLDKYTELMQAGPLLLKEGRLAPNTENIAKNVLEKRHPRTFVGTDGSRIVWGVVDGRSNMHSVGMTIEELRRFCAQELALTDALNLDGGGSSSIWWHGMTFSLPSNSGEAERPIPYAVLMLVEGETLR